MSRKTDTLTVRLDPKLRADLEAAMGRLPYPTTITAVVERGLHLAMAEMDRIVADTRPERQGAPA